MLSTERGIRFGSDYYVYSPSVTAGETFLYPISVGHFVCEPGYALFREAYDSYLVLYVKSGRLIVSAGGKEQTAPAGHFVLLDCYRPHAYWTEEGCESLWCHFDGVTSAAFCRHVTTMHGLAFTLRDAEFPLGRLEAIYRLFSEGAVIREPLLSRYLNDILTAFLLSAEEEPVAARRRSAAEAAVTYIGEHLQDSVTVEELAAQAGLSLYHFIRVFRRQTGYSPYEYLRNARVNMAKYLLLHTDLPLKDICLRVGFSCESVFCRAFKSAAGLTPTEYRRQAIGSSRPSL